ncbi:MAG: hypothetical protein ACRC3Z_08920 [Phocaeicola sp.]
MNLTADQLKSVEELAYRLIAPELVAINLGVDELDFIHAIRTPGTDARNAYYRGYLQQTIEVREGIIKTAKNGSNPAQVELLKFLNDVNQHLKYE